MNCLALVLGALLLATPAAAASRAKPVKAVKARANVPRPPLVADTLVRIRMLDGLGSKYSHAGDRFRYVVVEDVIVDGFTWIRRGTRGAGVVTRVKRAGRFGQNGKITAAFGRIAVAARRQAMLTITRKATSRNDQEKLAAGAAFLGLLALGPIGLAGGAFVKG